MSIQPEGLGAIGIVAAWLVREAFPRIQKRRNSGNCKPGLAQVCRDRGEKLAGIDKTLEHIEEAMKENKEDHRRMFKKLDELK